MPVNINTKMIALLGKPLSQSYAARMQNAAYRAAGINMLYFYSEVENDHLLDVLNGIRYMSFAGCAITKPNKVEVMKYVDEVDPLAKKMNASNTLVLKDGKFIAYNTDGLGFLRAFQEDAPEHNLPDTTFITLGAGGAGRAICSVLAFNGAKKIYVYDLNTATADELVKDINDNFCPIAERVDIEEAAFLKGKVAESNVIMNNTGLGMIGSSDKTPVPKDFLNPDQLCFDATYNPAKTRFLLEAEQVGCKIMNGLGMSLYQGAEQIKLWSGQDAPIEVMREELFTILSHRGDV